MPLRNLRYLGRPYNIDTEKKNSADGVRLNDRLLNNFVTAALIVTCVQMKVFGPKYFCTQLH